MAVSPSLGRHFWDHLRALGTATVVIDGADPAPELIDATTLVGMATRVAIACHRRGMEAGARVLIASETRTDALVVVLATWMLGAVTVHMSPDLTGPAASEAIARAKPQWIVAEHRRQLGGLELIAGDEVGTAQVILLEDAPTGVESICGYATLLAEGLRHQVAGLGPLAKTMFAVPSDARAAIFYWPSDDGVAAAAVEHGELIAALAVFPPRWNVREGAVFMALHLGTRHALLTCLRALAGPGPIAFQGTATHLAAAIDAAAPRLIVADRDTLEALLDSLDRATSQATVRGALKRGLSWVSKVGDEVPRKTAKEAAVDAVVVGVEDWVERDLARAIKKRLGGQLKTVWCPDETPTPAALALLEAADVRFVSEER